MHVQTSSTARFRALFACCVVALIASSCADDGGDESATTPTSTSPKSTSAAPPAFRLVTVGEYDQPIAALAVPHTDQIAVVEKGGRVWVVSGMVCSARDKCPAKPKRGGALVLDISGKVSDGSEQGLLGMAFHPRWPDDPRIFIDYTDRDGDTHIEAWSLATPTGKAAKEGELLRIDQPYENHNGGDVVFGPDGLLYIGMGDGGAGGDPEDRAQSEDERLGKILRVDVDAGGERGYGIPKGNLEGGAPEVWALGMRNPWRFTFDRERGDLWIGEVGQDSFEEIDAVPKSAPDATSGDVPNFEWRLREGFDSFDDSGSVGPGRRTPPVLVYGRAEGCSVTGGYVYRGEQLPALRGWFVFADFCKDDLRLVNSDGLVGDTHAKGSVKWVRRRGAVQTSSFGETHRGELLVISLEGGIRQIVPAR